MHKIPAVGDEMVPLSLELLVSRKEAEAIKKECTLNAETGAYTASQGIQDAVLKTAQPPSDSDETDSGNGVRC